MTTQPDQNTPEPDRLAALERQISALTAAHDRKEREAAALEQLRGRLPASEKTPRSPELAAYNTEVQARQAAALELRREAHAKWAASYEAQLERVAPDREKPERQVAEISDKRRDLGAKHAAAVAQVDAELGRVNAKLNALMAPPPLPPEPQLVGTTRETGRGVVWEHGRPQSPPVNRPRR